MLIEPLYVPWVLISWKRRALEFGFEYWSNDFHFAAASDIDESTAYTIAHNIATAEQFMYANDVEQFGYMVYQPSAQGDFAEKEKLFIWKAFRFGGRPITVGDTRIPFRFALAVMKHRPQGKSGRMAFRNVLWQSETVPFRETGLAIRNDRPMGDFATALPMYWLNNVPIPHAIFTRLNELAYPLEVRPVEALTVGYIMDLQSVEDAQARKTPAARSYEVAHREMLWWCFQYVRTIESLRFKLPDGMEKKDIENLITIQGDIKSRLIQVIEYWDEGVKPYYMENWRIYSGLDPMSFPALSIAERALGQFEELDKKIKVLQDNPLDPLPPSDTLPYAVLFSWVVGLIERVSVCRFTGTPVRTLAEQYVPI